MHAIGTESALGNPESLLVTPESDIVRANAMCRTRVAHLKENDCHMQAGQLLVTVLSCKRDRSLRCKIKLSETNVQDHAACGYAQVRSQHRHSSTDERNTYLYTAVSQ